MSVEIIVPALGESVSEATIAKWYKKQGDQVKVDELLLELETEKVTLEINASAEGILDSILRPQGQKVTIGEVVGTIKPAAAGSKQQQKVGSKLDSGTTMTPPVDKTDNHLNTTSAGEAGKESRITKNDAPEVSPPKPLTMPNASSAKPVERVQMSGIRRVIAQRLKESQNTAAILTTFNEIDMSNVISLRQKYREEFEKKHGVKLGFMSFFVRATVEALKAIPAINAEIDGDEIVYKNYYDIGVAVGTEQGLVVPVVRNSDKLTFAEIEKDIVNLSKKAREGKLAMSDLTGGTFSITNGGVYGSLLSTPIINPPQSGILALHKTGDRPVAVNGKVEIRPMMYIALSYDHRLIDGKDAVTFLVKIKESIENPERLLLNV